MANILFVCKWNRFRSKIAEDYFNKINKNKKLQAKSAGIIEGWTPLDEYQVEEAEKLGVNLKGSPQGLTIDLLKWADIIILVSKDVPESIFEFSVPITALNGKEFKVIAWELPDAKFGDREAAKKIIIEIKNKVNRLVKEES